MNRPIKITLAVLGVGLALVGPLLEQLFDDVEDVRGDVGLVEDDVAELREQLVAAGALRRVEIPPALRGGEPIVRYEPVVDLATRED